MQHHSLAKTLKALPLATPLQDVPLRLLLDADLASLIFPREEIASALAKYQAQVAAKASSASPASPSSSHQPVEHNLQHLKRKPSHDPAAATLLPKLDKAEPADAHDPATPAKPLMQSGRVVVADDSPGGPLEVPVVHSLDAAMQVGLKYLLYVMQPTSLYPCIYEPTLAAP